MPWKNLKRRFVEVPRLPLQAEPEPPSSGRNEPEAPDCPMCRTTMSWYESHLRRDNGRSMIVHSFHCLNCAHVLQIEEPFRSAPRLVVS